MWTGESGSYFWMWWHSKIVSSLLLNNKPIWGHNSNNLLPLPHAIWHMLWRPLIAEGALGTSQEWIRIPSDACGRANLIWIPSAWTGKFLNLERKSCGLKNIQICVDSDAVTFIYLKMRNPTAIPKARTHIPISNGGQLQTNTRSN